MSAEEATPIGIDLCQALAAVHGRGLVHRDVKAQNVMREDGGRTVLMDFGAGTELATRPAAAARHRRHAALSRARALRREARHARLRHLQPRGPALQDGHARYPVDGADRSEIERAHRDGRVRRLRDARPDLPSEFIQTVERALSPDPTARPQTAGELEAALTGKTAPAAPSWSWWQRAAAVAAAIVLVAVPVAWFVSNQTNRPGTSNPSPAAAVERTPATPAAAVNPSYTVQARMFRTRKGVETPLTAGTELAVGDKVSMSVEASKEVYVYVLNTDDAGKTYRLFPLADHQPDNPLAPSKEHRLPGDVGVDWAVDSAGGREHFVIMVNPVRVDAVEAFVRSIPAASEGRGGGERITTRDVGVLRLVGGLVKDKAIAKASEPALLWFEEASDLTGQQETASGAWMRRLTRRRRAPPLTAARERTYNGRAVTVTANRGARCPTGC